MLADLMVLSHQPSSQDGFSQLSSPFDDTSPSPTSTSAPPAAAVIGGNPVAASAPAASATAAIAIHKPPPRQRRKPPSRFLDDDSPEPKRAPSASFAGDDNHAGDGWDGTEDASRRRRLDATKQRSRSAGSLQAEQDAAAGTENTVRPGNTDGVVAFSGEPRLQGATLDVAKGADGAPSAVFSATVVMPPASTVENGHTGPGTEAQPSADIQPETRPRDGWDEMPKGRVVQLAVEL